MQEVSGSPRTPAASMLPGGKDAEEREVVAVAHNLLRMRVSMCAFVPAKQVNWAPLYQ